MKFFAKSMFVALGLGAVLFGCSPDNVNPTGDSKEKSVAGAFDDVHQVLDTICKYSDSVFFRSPNGSFRVDKCVGAGGTAIACTMAQPKWGSFVMYNGYTTNTSTPVHWLNVDFGLAGGWMCDFNNWLFTTNNSISMDPNTNLPSVGTDWSSVVYNPYRNQWKVSILVADLPSPSFDMSCRLSVLRLRLNGTPNENFRTTVWAINPDFANPAKPASNSNSEYVIRYEPFGCLEQVAPPRLDSTCATLTVGAPALASCATISADTTGAGITYAWSTGATTQTISVCPTATTTYTVTISAANHPVVIKTIKVYYRNISCQAGNSPKHKVWVCHYPPGNPNNPQDICIDWSGVPAHVARFRAPGANPNQGHDSGCEIGKCGSNPCQ